MNEGYTIEIQEEEECMCNMLKERESQEEILWRQKTRVSWLKDEERNTKFFHRSIIQNYSQNRILMINYSNGEILEIREDIKDELGHEFQDVVTEPILERSGDIEQIA